MQNAGLSRCVPTVSLSGSRKPKSRSAEKSLLVVHDTALLSCSRLCIQTRLELFRIHFSKETKKIVAIIYASSESRHLPDPAPRGPWGGEGIFFSYYCDDAVDVVNVRI